MGHKNNLEFHITSYDILQIGFLFYASATVQNTVTWKHEIQIQKSESLQNI